MKTKKHSLRLLMIICLPLLAFAVLSCSSQKADQKVMQAYDLRMSGHADSSVVMLDASIESNPANAAAWYELARTKYHLLMAGKDYKIGNIITDASEAARLDPDNVSYAYFEGIVRFLAVYIDIMQGKEAVKDALLESNAAFERALEADECYVPALISLIEINANLPEEMGGGTQKAEKYLSQLDACDMVEGLKGQAFLLPEGSGLLAFWQNAYETNPDDATVAEELGRAWLMEGNMEEGKKFIEEAVSLDSDKSYVLIDLGRAHGLTAMQDPENVGSHTVAARAALQQYLDMNPDVSASLIAYVYHMMARVSDMMGDAENVEKYNKKSKELDVFCSKAFGAPPDYLFVAPGVATERTQYFSRPF